MTAQMQMMTQGAAMAAQQLVAPIQNMMGFGDPLGDGPLLIRQKIDLLEAVTGCEAKNRYSVNEDEFFIREESDCLPRTFCGKNRPLKMYVHRGKNKEGDVLYVFDKSCHMDSPLPVPMPCMRPEMKIMNPEMEPIGRVYDQCSCCALTQQIFDKEDNRIYDVNGSLLQCGLYIPCCGNVDFDVTKVGDAEEKGKIAKIFGGCAELIAGVNQFQLDFPPAATGDQKALILGATMLADLQYFEANMAEKME